MGIENKLKTLRKEKGLTQEQLAKAVGLSKSAIVQYENGYRKPSFEALSKLENFFSVDSSYLLGRSKDNHFTESKENVSQCVNFEFIETIKNFINSLPQEEKYFAHSIFETLTNIITNRNISLYNYLDFIATFEEIITEMEKLINFSIELSNNTSISVMNQKEKYIKRISTLINLLLEEILKANEV